MASVHKAGTYLYCHQTNGIALIVILFFTMLLECFVKTEQQSILTFTLLLECFVKTEQQCKDLGLVKCVSENSMHIVVHSLSAWSHIIIKYILVLK